MQLLTEMACKDNTLPVAIKLQKVMKNEKEQLKVQFLQNEAFQKSFSFQFFKLHSYKYLKIMNKNVRSKLCKYLTQSHARRHISLEELMEMYGLRKEWDKLQEQKKNKGAGKDV